MSRLTLTLLILAIALASAQADLSLGSWGDASSIATIGLEFFLVSKNNSHIRTQSYSTFHVCDLELNDTHTGGIQVAGVERKILLLYRQNSTSIQILQLDPFLCLFTALPSLKTSVESTDESQLIVMNNTLDVFLKGADNCFPCRFDVHGNRLAVTTQLTQSNSSLKSSFIIKEFMREGREYAYVINFANGSAALKILDENFNTTSEIYFMDHQIEALAANSVSNQTRIGITYAGKGSPYERVLALYTGTLESLFATPIEHDSNYKLFDTLLAIDSNGYTLVNSVQAIPSPTHRYTSYAIYNTKGQLHKRGDLQSWLFTNKYDWQLLRHKEDVCSAVHRHWSDYAISDINCYYYFASGH